MDKLKILKLLKKKNVVNAFVEQYSNLKLNALKDGGREGWAWKIILNKNGAVNYMYNKKDFIREDVKQGEAIVLAIIDSIQIVSEECMGDVEDELTRSEYNEFIQYLKDKYSIEEEIHTWEYFTWKNIYDFDENIYKRAVNRAWRQNCFYSSDDEAKECINNIINKIKG